MGSTGINRSLQESSGGHKSSRRSHWEHRGVNRGFYISPQVSYGTLEGSIGPHRYLYEFQWELLESIGVLMGH